MPIRMSWVPVWGVMILLLGLAAAGPRGSAPAAPSPPPAASAPAQPATDPSGTLLALDGLAPQFLGMFRKSLTIEAELRRFTERYGVDFDLARAVLIQESGGNPHLTSVAGAGGYFQVMPATFRGLRVETNVEAGIKYISQMVRQFGREDYAVAAYNGGPVTRAARPAAAGDPAVRSLGRHLPQPAQDARAVDPAPRRPRSGSSRSAGATTGGPSRSAPAHRFSSFGCTTPSSRRARFAKGSSSPIRANPRPDLLVPDGPGPRRRTAPGAATTTCTWRSCSRSIGTSCAS